MSSSIVDLLLFWGTAYMRKTRKSRITLTLQNAANKRVASAPAVVVVVVKVIVMIFVVAVVVVVVVVIVFVVVAVIVIVIAARTRHVAIAQPPIKVTIK